MATEAQALEQMQQASLQGVTAALDALTAKDILEFGFREEYPVPLVERAATAVAALASDRQPFELSSWSAVKPIFTNPGALLDGMRRLVRWTDQGRIGPDAVRWPQNLVQDVNRDDLAGDSIALRLFDWAVAAIHYVAVSSEVRIRQFNMQQSLPVAGAELEASNGAPAEAGDAAAYSPPPAEGGFHPAGQALQDAAGQAATRSSAQQAPSPSANRRPVRTSAAGSTAGRSSLGSSTPASSVRSPNVSRTGTRQPAPATSQRNHLPLAMHSRQALEALQQASGTFGGRGVRPSIKTRLGVEDVRNQLEQLRRETREMKAMEAQMKWTMKREEEKLRKTEKKEDTLDILAWRQQQQKETAAYATKVAKEKLAMNLQDSKVYQEHKREVKVIAKEEAIKDSQLDYEDTKERAQYHAEMVKTALAERQRQKVEEHIEQYRLVAEYNLEEQQRDHAEERESRMVTQQREMELQLAKAKRERDLALQSLEHLKSHEHEPVPPHWHLAATPK